MNAETINEKLKGIEGTTPLGGDGGGGSLSPNKEGNPGIEETAIITSGSQEI